MASLSAANSIISMRERCPRRCGSARCFDTEIRGHMTGYDFAKLSALAASLLTISVAAAPACAEAPLAMRSGDVLTGQLNAMRSRGAKGKRASIFQLASQPHRLPPPSGLCGLEPGPETFQIVASTDAQIRDLQKFVGKEISIVVDDVACATEPGQMSEAVVTKWSVMQKHFDRAF